MQCFRFELIYCLSELKVMQVEGMFRQQSLTVFGAQVRPSRPKFTATFILAVKTKNSFYFDLFVYLFVPSCLVH